MEGYQLNVKLKDQSNTHRSLEHKSSKLLRVPMKPTGKAQAIINPAVAAHDTTYRPRISKAPSLRFCQTMSFGLASIHLEYIHSGWKYRSISSHESDRSPDLVVAEALRQNVGTHLKVTSDEHAAQEVAFHDVLSTFLKLIV
jgi:hypothetical protein